MICFGIRKNHLNSKKMKIIERYKKIQKVIERYKKS